MKQEHGKLSKTAVDKIPLVLYIPAPEDPGSTPAATSYPHHPTLPATPKSLGRLFYFLVGDTRKPSSKKKGKARDNCGSGDSWEDNWEKGEYPFIRLEGNHATCAICLVDFPEPKRAETIFGKMMMRVSGRGMIRARPTPPKRAPQDSGELRLEDAGEGPQPLRLLPCGHVLHVSKTSTFLRLPLTFTPFSQKTCLDPWLIRVSARCPICNRIVRTGGPGNSESTRRGTWI